MFNWPNHITISIPPTKYVLQNIISFNKNTYLGLSEPCLLKHKDLRQQRGPNYGTISYLIKAVRAQYTTVIYLLVHKPPWNHIQTSGDTSLGLTSQVTNVPINNRTTSWTSSLRKLPLK